MENVLYAIKYAFSLLGAILGALLGGLDGFLMALLILQLLDFISGIIAGLVTKTLSSKVSFKGIAKKVLMLVLVAVGYLIDSHILHDTTAVVRNAIIFYYCASEGLSIIENCGRIGLPIPKVLKDALEQLKEQADNGTKPNN